ncbi:DUF4144 family protein [Pseudoalteromonas sp.]|uniref:DUF4144 family protein n=1 Tax=unclassified Pseudoalteromonas TaxID=194690 RepID=UPI003F97F5D3
MSTLLNSTLFPQFIIFNNELEVAKSEKERADLLYGLNDLEQQSVVILNYQQQYTQLNNKPCNAISAKELADLVKDYLHKEGHCCLAKIDSLTPEQAFALVALN